MQPQLKYFSMFTGIAGFEYGIQKAFSDQQNATIREGQGRKGNVDQDGRRNVHSGSFTPLCVGYSEIDQYAIGITTFNYPGHKNYGNARRIIPEQLPDFDLLIGGFPCQSFSIAGKRGGLEDIRGTLFFEIARILRTKRPKTFILENVRGLFSAGITDEGGNLIKGTSGFVFKIIIATLRDMGYDIEWQCINSKDHGVPQNRERVFIIGHLAGSGTRKIFPLKNSSQEIIQERDERIVSGTISTKNQSGQVQFDGSTTLIMPREVNPELSYPIKTTYQKGHYDKSRGTLIAPDQINIIDRNGNPKNKNIASTLTNGGHAAGNHSDMDLIQIGTLGKDSEATRVYDPEGIARTIKNGGGGGAKTGLYAVGYTRDSKGETTNKHLKDTFQSLNGTSGTSSNTSDLVLDELRIRRLTPIECERLQGFPDNWTQYGIFYGKLKKKDVKFRDTHPDLWKECKNIYGNEMIVREISDSRRYQCCGNAVTTTVIKALIQELYEI